MRPAAPSVERLVSQILDLDYGDEQERLRYYEVYAVAVHVQFIALPAAGAAAIAVAGRSAIGPVLVMMAVAFVPILFGLSHLRRHRVRTEAIAFSARNRGYMAAFALSYVTLFGVVSIRGSRSGFAGGLATGAALGVVLGIAALAVAARRQRDTDSTVDPED